MQITPESASVLFVLFGLGVWSLSTYVLARI